MSLRKRLLFALGLMVALITISVTGYLLLGGSSVGFLQALYMAVITVAGVGYGEIVDTSHNPVLRVFNMGIVLFGVAITVYVFSVVAAFLVEVEVTNPLWRRRMQKRISELENHFIVCGLGDTGRHAVEELKKTHSPHIVVDISEDHIKSAQEAHRDVLSDLLYVVGDATLEDVLEKAGLAKARGLIAALPNDKDNLVITVVVHQRCPQMRIVSRAEDPKFAERMRRAGGDAIVSPSGIGGLRMASEMIRPHVVGFLDQMVKEQGKTVRVDEIELAKACPWVGMTLHSLNFKERYNLLVLGLKAPGVSKTLELQINPADHAVVPETGVLIVLGEIPDVERARQDAKGP
jgi:voltage-gated potassium channel